MSSIADEEGWPLLLPGRLLIFNGGERAGVAKLLIHIHIARPVPAAILTRVTIQRKGTGLHAIAKTPVIARGGGSLIDFDFEMGATYTHKDKKVGYFEARCPDEVFRVNAKKLLFRNEAQTPGEGASTSLKGALAVPCTPDR